MKANKALFFVLLGLVITLLATMSASAACSGYDTNNCNNNNYNYNYNNCGWLNSCGGYSGYSYQRNYYWPSYTYSWRLPTYSSYNWYSPTTYFSWYRPTYSNYGGWGSSYGTYNTYYGGYGGNWWTR